MNTSDLNGFVRDAPASVLEAFSSKRLRLILLPTERCNLRCTYCYEEFLLGRMTPGVEASVAALIARAAPRLGHLQIDWFGGEPLLAKDIVLRLMAHARHECLKSGTALKGTITTNATLLNPFLLDELTKVGVTSYQITLDGSKSSHDRQRVTVRGDGTFDRIICSLSTVHSSCHAVSVVVRMHITPTTIVEVEETLQLLREMLDGDQRFTFLFHSVDDLGGPGSNHVSPWPSEASKYAALSRLSSAATNLGLNVGNAVQNYVCYAAHANSFVVRSNGRLNKCTVALQSPLNDVGEISPLGDLVIRQDQHNQWFAGTLALDASFSECPSAFIHAKPATRVIPIAVGSG